MVRITVERYDVYAIGDNPTPAVYIQGYCLSDDTMPTDIGGSAIATGSKLKAVDTGDEYYYDEVSEAWAVPTPADSDAK